MNGLAFLLVIVGGTALAGPAWRSLLDESKSVEEYQRCLSVLGDQTRSAANRVSDAGGALPAGGDSGASVEQMASAGHVRVVPADIAAAARSSQRPSRRSSGPPHATRTRNSRGGSRQRRTGSLHPGSRAVLVPSPIRLSLPPELELHAGRPVFGAGDPPSDQAPDAAPSADKASATDHDPRRRPRRPRTGAWRQSKRLAVAAAVSAFAGIAVPAAGELARRPPVGRGGPGNNIDHGLDHSQPHHDGTGRGTPAGVAKPRRRATTRWRTRRSP